MLCFYIEVLALLWTWRSSRDINLKFTATRGSVGFKDMILSTIVAAKAEDIPGVSASDCKAISIARDEKSSDT
jgi:hypothetical protein